MIEFGDELSQRLGLPAEFARDSNFSRDDNNNKGEGLGLNSRGDKYSLRPRSLRRNINDDGDEIITIPSKTKAKSKSKQKPAPLSKYRRKTANARERSRMQEINQAFEALRRAVPQMSLTHQSNEKLTKITTLRLAMKYIAALSSVLNTHQDNSQDLLSDCSELDCFLLESDGESLPLHSDLSDHSLTPADFSVDFDDSLTSVDFAPLSQDLTEHLGQFDPFISGFS